MRPAGIIIRLGVTPASRWFSLARLLALVALGFYLFLPPEKSPFSQKLELQDGTVLEGLVTLQKQGYAVRLESGEVRFVMEEELKSGPHAGASLFFPRWILLVFLWPLLLLMPYFALWLVYKAVFVVAALLCALYAFMNGSAHPELQAYLARFLFWEARLKMFASGFTGAFPQMDVMQREQNFFPMLFGYRPQKFEREQSIPVLIGVRQTVLVFPWRIMQLACAILFWLSLPVLWIFALLRGDAPDSLKRLLEKLIRHSAEISAYSWGLTADAPPFWPRATGVQGDLPDGYETFEKTAVPSMEMNLILLALLIFFTAGLYSFFYLSRVARILGYDSFSMVASALLVLPVAGVYFIRIYRRTEKLVRQEPGAFLEFLCALPVFNLLFAPVLVQLILNEYERARRLYREKGQA